MKEISARLVACRQHLHLSRLHVELRLGFPAGTLRRIEDEGRVSIGEIDDLARFYGVDVDYVIDGPRPQIKNAHLAPQVVRLADEIIDDFEYLQALVG